MELEEYRKEIDQVDAELLKLFRRRMELSAAIGDYKRAHRLPVFNPQREREILAQVCEEAGPQYGTYARQLFETLFDLSRSCQNQSLPGADDLPKAIQRALQETPQIFPPRGSVACQGVEGAYSQIAAERLFPQGSISYFKTWEGVFNAVEKGLCKFGVLPIENSTHGTIVAVYDLMRHHNFHIVRSIKLQVNHVLVANPGVRLDQIKEIFSHEQALGQCSGFLKAHPQIKATAVENTAVAAKMVMESGRDDVAAICSAACADLYNLRILEDHVQNSDFNYTRFICITKTLEVYPGANRISLMLTVPHHPGALCQLMAKFSALGVNLLKLESRPVPGRDFEFLFYFDFEATIYDPDIVRLLGQLANSPEFFVLLGCYMEV